MKWLGFAVITASMISPAAARDQRIAAEAPAPAALDAPLASPLSTPLSGAGFQNGLDECAIAPVPGGYALSGTGRASFGDAGGIDLVIDGGDGGAPTVSAHAINTKGTGATNHRAIGQSCAAPQPTPRGVAGNARGATGAGAACTVSGDPDAPTVRFTIPLSAFGTANQRGGHVTLLKREAGSPPVGTFLSKRGYDYYQAKSETARAAPEAEEIEMAVIASCDTGGLVAKGGKPVAASYDLAVGKKA